ncbi:hypothetical protein M9H77_07711 [Catharanthus roseus]|uniref:Uncharacterized protein n=1 Tax=Catharanthus roseus TaxID=4058 RepID=A0ACC0BVU6_CATRO|nr:hypothetical protein M9H77_07711 [Catharanthus roseus]
MRIRKSSFYSVPSSPCASPSCSSSFPPSSISSSSSITANSLSLASSTDSSSSFSPCSSNLATRCQGLDLLVKAIHLVTAGSVVGVPYIQRRIVRRRRRALKFNSLILSQFLVNDKEQEQGQKKKKVNSKARSKSKRQKRAMALPSKYQDSVLQPLKPKTRRQRSTQIDAEMGS